MDVPLHQLDDVGADAVPFLQVDLVVFDGDHLFFTNESIVELVEITFGL